MIDDFSPKLKAEVVEPTALSVAIGDAIFTRNPFQTPKMNEGFTGGASLLLNILCS
jgi:hypothetical protein